MEIGVMATRRRGGRAPDTTSVTLPSPIGGLNDRDPIANMPGTDAVILENWWPEPGQLSIRKGCVPHHTGLPSAIGTLTEYWPPEGDSQLFAASGNGIYDVTFAGQAGQPVVDGLSSDQWQVAHTTTAGGSFQLWMNGVDKPLLYDGSTWTSIDDSSTPAITGLETSRIIDGVVFKNRVYLVERNSMSLWYLPVQSIAGEADYIPMGQIFRRGGHIVTAQTWTIDAGEGSDDHFVVLSSNGEVAVFAGYDPTDASNWRIVGVFYLGRPIGQRPCIKFGGDLLVVCEDGVFPLGSALMSASIDRRVAVTDKIQNSIKNALSQKSRFGWQLCLSPENSALLLNVPEYDGSFTQFAQNTLTGAWTKFSGWNAQCWLDSSRGLFFGDSQGNIMRAWTTSQDNGQNIIADCLQAFSAYGANSTEKFFTMIRPYLESTGTPSIQYTMCGDFNIEEPTGILSYTPPQGMVWGSMIWDASMFWGGSKSQMYDWRTVGKLAKSGAVRLRCQNNGSETSWAATDIMFTRGWYL